MKTTKQKIAIAAALFIALWVAQTVFAFYDPSQGRWLSRDPIGEPGFQVASTGHFELSSSVKESLAIAEITMNSYRFVENNPFNKTDALGLSPGELPTCYSKDDIKDPSSLPHWVNTILEKTCFGCGIQCCPGVLLGGDSKVYGVCLKCHIKRKS